MSARFQFLPWVRLGTGAAVKNRDTLAPNLPGRVSLPVRLRVNERQDVQVPVQLYGPGDINGIDRRLIIRTNPRPLTPNFEPNLFPAVEFSQADFPWMFTPASGNPNGRLRPWLCLVAVRKGAGVSLASTPRSPLPVLSIRSPALPAEELPDLSESWAWAHTQLSGPDGEILPDEILQTGSALAISRLVCPRRLEANRTYLACLVPAFDVGRKAGLGLRVEAEDEAALLPAWLSGNGAVAEIELPVYFHWEFSTGPGGDFESLARLLKGQQAPPGLGTRSMRVEDLGFGLPDLGLVELSGALRGAGPDPAPLEAPAFQAALEKLLNLPASQLAAGGADPLLAPPIYGSRQASQAEVPPQSTAPRWLRELNLDPRRRAAAGLGVMVVQDQQEALMASAWEQLGEAQLAIQPLRQIQLAREVLKVIHQKHLAPLPPDQLFAITGPVHSRVRASPQTLYWRVHQSQMPETAASTPFRKIARPRGPVARRLAPRAVRPTAPLQLTNHLAAAPFVAVFFTRPLPGMISAQSTLIQIRKIQRRIFILTQHTGEEIPEANRFIEAVSVYQDYFERTEATTTQAARPGLALEQVQADLLRELDPAKTLQARVSARISLPEGPPAAEENPAGAIGKTPVFPRPMYEALRDLSPELLLPGLADIPQNSILLLETNPQFVEAYLVGLNHEMSRELLWREYPSDQRGTSFRRFWDRRGVVQGRDGNDIEPIHLWDGEKALGENFSGPGVAGQLVLLLRGELLSRYPNTLIYAVEAASRTELGGREKHPVFRGSLGSGVAFLGFNLSEEEARGRDGHPGWFFMIQQQPGEPSFGLDAPTASGGDLNSLQSWNDLSWGHLAADEQALLSLHHVPLGGRLAGKRIGTVEWGLNSAHMAAITLQRPVRVAVHAADLLPPTPGGGGF